VTDETGEAGSPISAEVALYPDAEETEVQSAFGDGTFFGDRFRIDGVLGHGGMGSVFEAFDLTDDSVVALKVLGAKRLPSEEARERFRRESQILLTLKHPCIVELRALGQSPEGVPWIAMEKLIGQTLRQRIEDRGALESHQVVPVLDATAEALEVAHAAGVIHRDLKPDNIFLPEGGIPAAKILDFGLSSAIGSQKLTEQGVVLGTPRYMAPEQIASASAADARSDVYALGVIIYEALTGRSPFTVSDHAQLLGAILQGNQRPLHELRPELPLPMTDVLTRAMSPRAEDRYPGPALFADAFASAAGLRGSSLPPPPPMTPANAPAARAPRTWRSAVALVVVLVAVGGLAGVLGWYLSR